MKNRFKWKASSLMLALYILLFSTVFLSAGLSVISFFSLPGARVGHEITAQRTRAEFLETSIKEFNNISPTNTWVPIGPFSWNGVECAAKRISIGLINLLVTRCICEKDSLFNYAMMGSNLPDTALLVSNSAPLALGGGWQLLGNIILRNEQMRTSQMEGEISNSLNRNLLRVKKLNSAFPEYDFKTAFDERLLDNLPIQFITAPDSLTLKNFNPNTFTVLKAPQVRIKEDGELKNVQIIATKKIILEDGVEAAYPTMLLCQGESPEVIINESCVFRGDVFVNQTVEKLHPDNLLYIDEKADIEGFVYANGEANIQGKVHGTVMVKGLEVRTPNGNYGNTLFNGKINRQIVPKAFATSISSNKNSVIKWLN